MTESGRDVRVVSTNLKGILLFIMNQQSEIERQYIYMSVGVLQLDWPGVAGICYVLTDLLCTQK